MQQRRFLKSFACWLLLLLQPAIVHLAAALLGGCHAKSLPSSAAKSSAAFGTTNADRVSLSGATCALPGSCVMSDTSCAQRFGVILKNASALVGVSTFIVYISVKVLTPDRKSTRLNSSH